MEGEYSGEVEVEVLTRLAAQSEVKQYMGEGGLRFGDSVVC